MSQHEEDFSLSPVKITTSSSLTQTVSRNQDSSASPSDHTAADGTGATLPTIGVNGATGLNLRSCVTCRKRKVKCDKRHPCSNCNRAAIECLFPGPGRAPRRSRKPPDTELLARLRRLEGVVQSLGKGIDEDGETMIEPLEKKQDTPERPPITQQPAVVETKPVKKYPTLALHEPKKDNKDTDGIAKEFGRLVVEHGKSRYVSNKFWSSLSEEVAEMRDILDDSTEDEDDYPSPESGSSASANHQGFIFSFSSLAVNLRPYHPPEEQIPAYWNIFITNVDPVMKLFHVPHHEKIISEASKDLDHISKPTEVFMFTIYYAAVTTLSPDDCFVYLGLEKQDGLRKYRFAVEQSLSRTGFLSTQELIVLQSLLLFLTCVRRSDDTRYVWTLTGLLIRLAQALGVHRDGQRFGLSPFETEMRRRLWWQICTLDIRASEDHGTDPSIVEQSFDTKFPLNVNDADLTTDMKEPPEEREGATEMTFDLIRYSVSTTVRRLSYAPPGPGPCRIKSSGLTLADKEHMIEELHQYLETKYLRHCDTKVPLHWVTATVARLIMAKMWLIVHHPFSRADRGIGLPPETNDRLFTTSLEVIEFSRLLETEKTTQNWGWLFRTYVQWHALAFLLSQLCTRTLGPEVDKAWMVIQGVLNSSSGAVSSNQRGMLWKPLKRLLARAKAERSKALQKQFRFPLDGSLGPTDSSFNLPPSPISTANGLTGFPVPEAFPSMIAPVTAGAMAPNGIQQPLLPTKQSQNSVMENVDQWSFDPAFFSQARPIEDENMAGWDEMAEDLQIGTDGRGQGIQSGPVGEGFLNWW